MNSDLYCGSNSVFLCLKLHLFKPTHVELSTDSTVSLNSMERFSIFCLSFWFKSCNVLKTVFWFTLTDVNVPCVCSRHLFSAKETSKTCKECVYHKTQQKDKVSVYLVNIVEHFAVYERDIFVIVQLRKKIELKASEYWTYMCQFSKEMSPN